MLKTIKITICQDCLDGKGQECHTPGCALFLHSVDLSIDKNLYEVIEHASKQGVPIGPIPSLCGCGNLASRGEFCDECIDGYRGEDET